MSALAFTIHMSLLGEEGFKRLARLNHAKAVQLAQQALKCGKRVSHMLGRVWPKAD